MKKPINKFAPIYEKSEEKHKLKVSIIGVRETIYVGVVEHFLGKTFEVANQEELKESVEAYMPIALDELNAYFDKYRDADEKNEMKVQIIPVRKSMANERITEYYLGKIFEFVNAEKINKAILEYCVWLFDELNVYLIKHK